MAAEAKIRALKIGACHGAAATCAAAAAAKGGS